MHLSAITVTNISKSFTYKIHTHARTRAFNGPLSGTTRVSRYQKGKTNLDFTKARDSEWQWHQQVCTSLQTDNHASTPPLSFLQAGCPSCRPTNSVKALKARVLPTRWRQKSSVRYESCSTSLVTLCIPRSAHCSVTCMGLSDSTQHYEGH